jgi:hypothetical protein
MGHKRQVICKLCASKTPETALAPPVLHQGTHIRVENSWQTVEREVWRHCDLVMANEREMHGTDAHQETLARLIQIMTHKGLLTAQEVLEALGDDYEKTATFIEPEPK